jgi:hypothetical protein
MEKKQKQKQWGTAVVKRWGNSRYCSLGIFGQKHFYSQM